MKLLHIDSSPLGGQSVSRALTQNIVAQWRAAHPGTTVEHLDLVVDAPSHLAMDSLGFAKGPKAEGLSDVQRRENEISERLVTQFLAADVIVLGAPMYNFSIPSQLKAWIDRVAQAGRTFKYTEQGPVGLAAGKTLIIASSRGGAHAANPVMDHQETYLRTVFGFLGITDIRIVRAEGLAMGEQARASALASAERDIHAYVTVAANEVKGVIAA